MAALKNATCSNKSGTQGEFVLDFNFRHPFAWNLGEISKVSWLIFTPMQTKKMRCDMDQLRDNFPASLLKSTTNGLGTLLFGSKNLKKNIKLFHKQFE